MLHNVLLGSVMMIKDFLICGCVAQQDDKEERVVSSSTRTVWCNILCIMRRAGRSRATDGWNNTPLCLIGPRTIRHCLLIIVVLLDFSFFNLT